MNEPRDYGSISVIMTMLVVVVLGGAALIVDGGRAMSARRHASNTAEAAARAAASTATPTSGFDERVARDAALSYARRAGVAAADVEVAVGVDAVTVRITERRTTVFLVLGGQATMTVHGTGTARVTFSG